MRTLRRPTAGSGRVRIDIILSDRDKIEILVARSCDDPRILRLVDAILEEAARREPSIVVKRAQPQVASSKVAQRKGGPVGMPEDRKLEIVREWFRVQGRTKEDVYVRSKGISGPTLRRWIREFRRAGKL